MFEEWKKSDDSTFIGRSFVVVQNDTSVLETLSIELKLNELYYIPVVYDQNNRLPISFKYISNTGGQITFENMEHDFPQRIIYSNPNIDILLSRIEGLYNGEFRKKEFTLTRSK